MNSARMSPGQEPDEFVYELNSRRERLNACHLPEGPTDRQFENIILQALPPEYERILTSHLDKTDFGVADIRRMMSAIYAVNLARLSLTAGIAGRGAAMPTAEDNYRNITSHYCERAGHFKNTCPSAPSTGSSDNNECNGTNRITSNRTDGVNEAGSVAGKRHASRQAAGGGRVCTTTLLTTAAPTPAPFKTQTATPT